MPPRCVLCFPPPPPTLSSTRKGYTSFSLLHMPLMAQSHTPRAFSQYLLNILSNQSIWHNV